MGQLEVFFVGQLFVYLAVIEPHCAPMLIFQARILVCFPTQNKGSLGSPHSRLGPRHTLFSNKDPVCIFHQTTELFLSIVFCAIGPPFGAPFAFPHIAPRSPRGARSTSKANKGGKRVIGDSVLSKVPLQRGYMFEFCKS